jgi:hypothetical protein
MRLGLFDVLIELLTRSYAIVPGLVNRLAYLLRRAIRSVRLLPIFHKI